MKMSDKSRAILEAIAKGHTYEQILVQDLAWTYHDIFQAAAEALQVGEIGQPSKSYSVEKIRNEHLNAYEKWDVSEDERLKQLSRSGVGIKQIATTLQRQPGAI